MRLRAISVKGFRGLRQVDFDLDPAKPFLMYGLNGTGKSSLFQALHFGITGELPPVSALQTAPPEVFRHRGMGEAEPAEVKITFEVDGAVHDVTRTIDAEGCLGSQFSSIEAQVACESPQNGLCFLTRPKFAAMVEDAERERWTRLSPLLGHEELAQFRDGMRVLALNVTRDLELTTLTREAEQARKAVHVLTSELEDACLAAQVRDHKQETVADAIVTLGFQATTSGAAIDWAVLERQLPGAQRIRTLSAEITALAGERRSLQADPLDGAKIAATLLFLREIHEDPSQAHALLHASFFQTASVAVTNLTTEPCPVCGLRPDNWDLVREQLEQRRSDLTELSGTLSTAVRFIESTRGNLDSLVQRTSDLLTDDVGADLNGLAKTQTKLRDYFELLGQRVERRPVQGISSDEELAIKRAAEEWTLTRDTHFDQLAEREASLQEAFNRASENPEYRQLLALRKVCEARDSLQAAITQCRRVENRLKATKRAVDLVQTFASETDRAESALSTDMLTQMGAEVARIFSVITSQPKLVPRIDTKTERGIRAAEIMIEDFHGLGEVPAREYLSEANRHALGLSIYFAGILRRGPSLEAIVLDDVSHSTDYEHRRGMAAFIARELAPTRQLFVFTHDKNWYTRLTTLLDRQFRAVKVTNWSPDGQTLETDRWTDLLHEADLRIRALDRTAGNDLRQAMEQFIDELCQSLDIDVPFRRDATAIKFEVKRQRLVRAIKGAWDSGNGIIDPSSAAVLTFATSQKVANLASHYGSFESWDHPDLMDALADVTDFVRLFLCKAQFQGAECGAIVSCLERRGGNAPQCRRCKQTFQQ